MADISITAANVAVTANTVVASGTAGETITAGQILYKDANQAFKLFKAVVTDSAKSVAVGVALNNASAGQPLKYATSGDIVCGGTLALGTVYVLGAGAGAIAPSADLDTSTATNYGTVIGVSNTTLILRLAIAAGGSINA